MIVKMRTKSHKIMTNYIM